MLAVNIVITNLTANTQRNETVNVVCHRLVL